MCTVLVVDDEQDLLDLYTDALDIMGYQVLQAHDGGQALEIARRERPALIVTDWMMPRLDGVELCQCVQRDPQLHDTPVLLHSSRRAPHLPGVRVLSKSCPLEEFEDTVAELIDASAPAAPATEGQGQGQEAMASW
jgi:CheY-like chemotaxis protein